MAPAKKSGGGPCDRIAISSAVPEVRTMTMTVQQWMNSPEKKPDVFKPFHSTGDIVVGLVRFDDAPQMFRVFMGAGYNGPTT